jgi:hypothetical protein
MISEDEDRDAMCVRDEGGRATWFFRVRRNIIKGWVRGFAEGYWRDPGSCKDE